MIRKLYHMMDKDEKNDFARLLALEMNTKLHRIYSTLGHRMHLKPQKIKPSQIELKHVSLGETKMWEFRLNSRDKVAAGDVGKIIVATRGLKEDALRKQRALLMAAEFYVYHAYANHPDPKQFDGIKSQSNYLSAIRGMLGMKNAQKTRDIAIRYVIEEMGGHKLAHYKHPGWTISITELKKHHPDIAQTVGGSENTFKEIFRKQKQRFTPDMLKQEEDLLNAELEELQRLIELLEEQKKSGIDSAARKLISIHIADLHTFIQNIRKIIQNLDKWILVDKREHKEFARKELRKAELRPLLQQESQAEKIDINKVHLIFHHFKKEKINILRDLELIQSGTGISRAKKGRRS
ncbi:hypothetical protein KY363_00110 [Candidatus Woesearchaeota archaeon]|nr:hypothetical protein [Candidatus Woesearchaeota archaeon]